MGDVVERIIIDADSSGAVTGLRKASGAMGEFGAATTKVESRVARVGRVAGIAGLAIAGGLAVALDKSVKAAMDAQVSTARLDQSFKVAGLSAKASAGQIDSAESASRKLGFTDTEVRGSLGSLVTATGDVGKSMRDLAVAQDVARFKHSDLGSATKMLTMAMTGSQRAAKQLGISVSPVTKNMDALSKSATVAEKAHAKLLDKMATGQAVIDAVSKKVHGQAAAFAGGAAGGLAQFRAQMDHLEVALGQGLLPALTSVAIGFSNVMAFMSAHTTATKVAVVALGGLAAVLLTVSVATKIKAAADVIAAGASKAMAAAQWLLNAALTANPIGIVVVALAALAAGLIYAYKHSATFRAIVSAAFGVVSAAARAVGAAISTVIGWIKALVGSSALKVLGAVLMAPFAAALGTIRAVSSAISNVASAARSAASAIKGAFTGGTGPSNPALRTGGASNIPGFGGGGHVAHAKELVHLPGQVAPFASEEENLAVAEITPTKKDDLPILQRIAARNLARYNTARKRFMDVPRFMKLRNDAHKKLVALIRAHAKPKAIAAQAALVAKWQGAIDGRRQGLVTASQELTSANESVSRAATDITSEDQATTDAAAAAVTTPDTSNPVADLGSVTAPPAAVFSPQNPGGIPDAMPSEVTVNLGSGMEWLAQFINIQVNGLTTRARTRALAGGRTF